MSEAIASKEERLVAYNANIAAADKDPSDKIITTKTQI